MSTTVPDTASDRQEIERARREMGEALFLLADRLAPSKLVPRLKESAKLVGKAKLEDLKERVSPVRIVRRKLNDGPKVIPARGYETSSPRARELP